MKNFYQLVAYLSIRVKISATRINCSKVEPCGIVSFLPGNTLI